MRKTLHEFTIEQYRKPFKMSETFHMKLKRCYDYAELTGRKPKLGDFVPCDLDGNVLEEPSERDIRARYDCSFYSYMWQAPFEEAKMQYKAAKSRVIFKGEWEVVWHSKAPHPRIYSSEYRTAIDFEESGVSLVRIDKSGFVIQRGRIYRIEDLPPQIEFKDEI